MSDHTDDESPLQFPCEFPIKAMGPDQADFKALVADIVHRHVPQQDRRQVRTRGSRNGRYLAVTVDILATSRAQLDAIYTDLSAHQQVVMAL